MSEYQYYEFQAIDRMLGRADQDALRALSTQARITATSFTNSYEWGDFKSDPVRLMENWFDLHLYLTNWGSRRLLIRWPARLVGRNRLGAFVGEVDCVTLWSAGQNLILDVGFNDVETEDPANTARTVGQLRARAQTIRIAHERAQAEKAAAERRRRDEEARASRITRLNAIRRRGESVWTEIDRRNATGYDKATSMLLDLRAIA